MPYEVVVPADLPIVEVHYSGKVSEEEVTLAATQGVERALQSGRFLYFADISRAESGPGTARLEQLAQALLESGVGMQFREAVVYAPGTWSEPDARLWESLCVARGLRVRAFGSRAEALAWLLAP